MRITLKYFNACTKPRLVLLVVLLNASCSSFTPNYYSLANVKQPDDTYLTIDKTIGVEQVIMPAYLSGRRLFITTADRQIKRLSGTAWIQDLDIGLTHRLIAFLQQKFRQPSVYHYPWDTDIAPDIKLTLYITRFSALAGQVYLQANWVIDNLSGTKPNTHLFNTTVSTDMSADNIVKAMSQGFGQLEEKIALSVKQY